MITIEAAKKKILSKHPGSKINSIMLISDGYLFNIEPINWDKNDILLGGYFKVSKTDGKISEYSPVMDPDEFKKAMQNVIYSQK